MTLANDKPMTSTLRNPELTAVALSAVELSGAPTPGAVAAVVASGVLAANASLDYRYG